MNEFDFHIGTQVRCLDGNCGKLAKLAIDPTTLQVTDLIVEEGVLLEQARVFPISTVAYALPKDVLLRLSSDELTDYAEYHEAEIERTTTGWNGRSGYSTEEVSYPTSNPAYDPTMRVGVIKEKIRQGISTELEVIAKGTLVKNLEGIVGKLSHLIADQETEEITHLVVQQGLLFPAYLNIPAAFVESISEEGIFLALSYEDLDKLWQQAKDPSS